MAGRANVVANLLVRKRVVALAVVLQLATCLAPVSAQVGQPQEYFTKPVPDTLLAPFTEFLSRFNVKDPKQTISRTRFAYIGDFEFKSSVGFRIEDKDYASCVDDRCLTIIGRLVGQQIVADVMFVAGAKVQRSDTVLPVFDAATLPYFFRSPHGDVMLIETPEGWLVAPLGN